MSNRFRIYVDEAGTHGDSPWMMIGMLFVPSHGALHHDLCAAKDDYQYFNTSLKHKQQKYKETHLAKFRSSRDLEVAKAWIDCFVRHTCYFRVVAIDWSIWKSSYFAGPFDSEAIAKRRAYKKWAEMLLHSELKDPCGGGEIRHATLLLDNLRTVGQYDVLNHLRDRFTANYAGPSPYIDDFKHVESWKDANQCLQLCDLLCGSVYHGFHPTGAKSPEKRGVHDYLVQQLCPFNIKSLAATFWKGYSAKSLTKHFPKFAVWCWHPSK